MQQNLILIKTADGSHSLFLKELNEHYHSVHGAIQESKHVYIDAGLNFFKKHQQSISSINILEIGMGTGLNVLLTFLENTHHRYKINYLTIEPFPLDKSFFGELNYIEQLNADEHKNVFQLIHESEWEKEIQLNENFKFKKINNQLQNILFEKEQFDVVYFDAFAPEKQAEMWTTTIFQKLVDATNINGVLVTYCAKGEVKRTLKKVGFEIEAIKGPPGKREMIRAKKIKN